MTTPIHAGDKLSCSGGDTPAKLMLSIAGGTFDGRAIATVKDAQTNTNIPPMGMCKFLTAKASGTPTPCQPKPQGWQGPSPGITLDGQTILTSEHKCPCSEGGVIEAAPADTVHVQVS